MQGHLRSEVTELKRQSAEKATHEKERDRQLVEKYEEQIKEEEDKYKILVGKKEEEEGKLHEEIGELQKQLVSSIEAETHTDPLPAHRNGAGRRWKRESSKKGRVEQWISEHGCRIRQRIRKSGSGYKGANEANIGGDCIHPPDSTRTTRTKKKHDTATTTNTEESASGRYARSSTTLQARHDAQVD